MKITELKFDSNSALVHGGRRHSKPSWHPIINRRRRSPTSSARFLISIPHNKDMLKQFQIFGVEENICFFKSSPQKRRNSQTHQSRPCNISMAQNASSSLPPLKCETETQNPAFDPHSLDPSLVQKIEYDALVWSSLRGLLVGDRASQVAFDSTSQFIYFLIYLLLIEW